jgi:DNA helicase II / ATP-dependent DNA helicase PcrA
LREKITTWIFSTCLVEHRDNVISGTIHSFALRLIQKYYEFMDKPFEYIIVDDAEEKDIRALFKNNKDAIDNYYLENKILTFDRIIQLFNYSAKQNSDFRDFIAKEVDEIVIDEAQDLNLEQYEMLWLLYENNPELKLFFVADQRQNIYGFRKRALRVNQTFGEKNVHNVDLELSYRCPQKILDFVNTFEFDDCNNVELKNHEGNQGSSLFIRCFENQKDEAEWIASNLEREKITGKALLDNAIIYPNSFYFEEILKALNKYNLSFRVFGGEYFLDDDIKLFRVLLNFINTENQYALQSILHQCGEYSLGVENVGQALERIRSSVSNSDLSFKAMECLLFATKHCETEHSPLEILEKFVQLLSDKQLLAEGTMGTYEQLHEIICNDLTLNDYHKLKFSINPKHPELSKFYKRSDQIVPCKNLDDPDYITVATVHSAKGLQWETVYIPGLYQDGFPHWFPDNKKQRGMFDELKKFYVSCTRARENLWLTRPKKVTVVSRKDQQKYTFDKPKSIFVRELKELYKDRNILK